MYFTLKQLRYVDAAGRCGSIANAASEFKISQSSINAAIDAFEFDLGFDLFIRTPARGIKPTATGRIVLDHIRDFLTQSYFFESDAASLGGELNGVLKIACHSFASPYFLPETLKSFTERFPGVTLDVVDIFEYESEDATLILQSGRAHLLIGFVTARKPDIESVTLLRAKTFILISNEDPLAKQKSVSLAQLAEKPMLAPEFAEARSNLQKIFGSVGLKPKIAYHTSSAEVARTMIAAGLGYSFFRIRSPDSLLQELGLCMLPISDELAAYPFTIATLPGIPLPRVARAFIEHCTCLADRGAYDHLFVTK